MSDDGEPPAKRPRLDVSVLSDAQEGAAANPLVAGTPMWLGFNPDNFKFSYEEARLSPDMDGDRPLSPFMSVTMEMLGFPSAENGVAPAATTTQTQVQANGRVQAQAPIPIDFTFREVNVGVLSPEARMTRSASGVLSDDGWLAVDASEGQEPCTDPTHPPGVHTHYAMPPVEVPSSPESGRESPELTHAPALQPALKPVAGHKRKREQVVVADGKYIVVEKFRDDEELTPAAMKRRANHNAIEKRRRTTAKQVLEDLKRAVRPLEQMVKPSKTDVMAAAAQYILELEAKIVLLEQQLASR